MEQIKQWSTEKLIAYLETLENKPKLLISGSAIGYYGIDKTDTVIEEKDNGDQMHRYLLAHLTQQLLEWEALFFPNAY
jgi:NAD dependent epimerase/dehydratase family enzyme